MAHQRPNLLTAGDIQAMRDCSRGKAIGIIKSAGGYKDSSGKWMVDAKNYGAWYHNPCRFSVAGGGDVNVDIEKVIRQIRDFSAGEEVNMGLKKPSGKPYWKLRVYGVNGEKVISLKTSKKKEAEAFRDELRVRFRQQQFNGIVPCNTQQLFDEWLTMKEDKAPKTYARYRAVIDKALPFMPIQAHMVRESDIERYRDWLYREKYQPNSIILELNTLSSIFKKGIRWGYVKSNPVEDVSKPERVVSEVIHYSQDEIDAIFTECDRRMQTGLRKQSLEAWCNYNDVLLSLFYFGFRIEDSLEMKWGNVNLVFSFINIIQGKTKKEVVVPIHPDFKKRLLELWGEGQDPDAYVFVNSAGNRLKYAQMDRAIRLVLESCGIEKKSPLHAFRHTAAMRLMDEGAKAHEIAGFLGDSVKTVLDTYVKPKMARSEVVEKAFSISLGSRQGPGNLHEMQVFEASEGSHETPPNMQKSPSRQGFQATSF